MDLLYYMLFSTLEGVGVFYLTLTLFRFQIKQYWFPLVLVNVLIAFISYTIRDGATLSWITPLIQVLLLAFFIQILIRIPIIWSVIMALTGIVAFTLIQTLALFGIVSINLVDLEIVKLGNTTDTYILQAIDIAIIFPLSHFLYRKGLGFTFDFGTFVLRWENILVLILLTLTFAALIFIFLMNNLLLVVSILVLCLAFFLLYNFRRKIEK